MKTKSILASAIIIMCIINTYAQVMVKDIKPGSLGSGIMLLKNINNTLFFAANDGVNGHEMWKSDGTETGTQLVKDINPNGDGINSTFPVKFVNVNNTLFFAASNNVNGNELWKTDGSAGGTSMVKDINPGTYSGIQIGAELINYSGKLFFNASDDVTAEELWSSDGSEGGTNQVKNISIVSSYIESFTVSNNILFFSADDSNVGSELWMTDGTNAGTSIVKNIASSGGSYPQFLTDVNGTLFFAAYASSTYGKELWKTDGTNAGTVMVKDINAGSGNSVQYTNVNNFININGILFFSATDGINGIELWRSDGTDAGTYMLKDIRAGALGGLDVSNNKTFMNVNGILFFIANDGSTGEELWKSDGTSAGTVLVKDIRAGSNYSDPREFTLFNNQLFFTAHDGINSTKLWKSDGTTAGTTIVNASGPFTPKSLLVVNNNLYFKAAMSNTGEELWKYDGTNADITETTSKLASVNIYPNPTNEYILVENKLIHTALNYSIYNQTGQILMSGILNSETSNINIKHLPAGMYLLKIGDTEYKTFKINKE